MMVQGDSAKVVSIGSPLIPIDLDFADVYAAWQQARKGKKPSLNQMQFERVWIDGIDGLSQQLKAGIWQPRRTVCFVVARPKIREIHAPDFADRVVHHWLTPRLEAIFEPHFIFDSYANRSGKGTHQAVQRVMQFARQQQDGESKGGGWYLQLDIHNFFYRIHRPTLYALLKRGIQRWGTDHAQTVWLQSLCHKLLIAPPRYCMVGRERGLFRALPAHKKLANAEKHYGLPIGNLTSQFFANVYLNELDQFIKHQLKVKRYVRYVDDFVLVADTPAHLRGWQAQIEDFLHTALHLRLKEKVVLQPLKNGIDFLGYRIYPHHQTVRPRVLAHCREKLTHWQSRYVRYLPSQRVYIKTDLAALQSLRSLLASYGGHFSHANSYRLMVQMVSDFSWLSLLFYSNPSKPNLWQPRWLGRDSFGLQEQMREWASVYPKAWIAAQCGYAYWVLSPQDLTGRAQLWRRVPVVFWQRRQQKVIAQGGEFVQLSQCAYAKDGRPTRVMTQCLIEESL